MRPRYAVPVCLLLAGPLTLAVWARDRYSQPVAVTRSPAARAPVPVTLDPGGRPYDAWLVPGARVVRRPLTVIHAPSGEVLFMGGEYVMNVKSGEYDPVRLAARPGRRYRVDAIWLDRKGTRLDEIAGVVLVERDGVVRRWKELDRAAYVTDGGVGGITTPEWADRPKGEENDVSRLYWSELVDKARQWFVADVDGYEGIDSVVFSNGFGDGYFPSVAGYGARGRLEIVLWSIAAPWRLAFPRGTPPIQVTRRERELAECLAGKRRVNGSRCRAR
jgi:hypothetical protein